jgi:hypothetical protein
MMGINSAYWHHDSRKLLLYYQRELVREIAGLLQEPSGVRLLAAQGVSEKAYHSCLRALASLEPDRPSADRIASSLASFATIRQWLNQQQLSVLRVSDLPRYQLEK